MAWNDEDIIKCHFSFQCPRTWGQLTPTNTESIRHCSECERDVHIALTEEDFRHHAEEGHCVATRLLQGNVLEENREEVFGVGYPQVRYNSYLKSK